MLRQDIKQRKYTFVVIDDDVLQFINTCCGGTFACKSVLRGTQSLCVTLLDTTYTHSWCTHCAWISCTAVHLYFSPVSVHSGTVYTTAQYNCTLASASLASVLSTNQRRALIYLLRSDWSIR